MICLNERNGRSAAESLTGEDGSLRIIANSEFCGEGRAVITEVNESAGRDGDPANLGVICFPPDIWSGTIPSSPL